MPDKSLSSIAGSIADNVKEADKAFKEGSEKDLLNRYILEKFNSRVDKITANTFSAAKRSTYWAERIPTRKNEKRIEIALRRCASL